MTLKYCAILLLSHSTFLMYVLLFIYPSSYRVWEYGRKIETAH